MTENEKLRALLAEAREWVPEAQKWPSDPKCDLLQRIDAALAEVSIEAGAAICWVKIPAGTITTSDGRVLTVERDFELAATPTTQAQYEAVMGENPSCFRGVDLPVERVSAHDADAFAAKIGARLPTEEEWEYACLAGSANDPYGPILDIARCWENSGGQPRPVGEKQPNAWGLFDMIGNVWEWTATKQGPLRVYCGGSWNDSAAWLCASYRYRGDPRNRNFDLGFRCARGGGK